jgi:multidrug efflux pump subunit AcrA (membrane-fusion protein)
MDILYLLDRLDNLIAGSRRMPLLNQVMLKEGDILSIIDQMRASIPEEVKQARRIIQEKERILAQAQSEASNLLTQARLESERALTREGLLDAAEERSQEIIQQAKERSQVMLRHAEEEADRLKIEADSYVTESLRALREHLLSIETDVGRTIMSIERGLETMERAPEESEMIDEVDEDSEAAGDHPLQQSPVRRASLAADTMGGPNFQA